MNRGSSTNIVPDEIPGKNGALDSLANLASHHRSITVKESSGNDTVDRDSGSSHGSEDDSKRRQKDLDDIDDFTPMSSVLNRHEPDGSVIESSIVRKQYECRKCGQPLKGHVCSVKSGIRRSDVQKSHLLKRRYRWRSRATLSDDEPPSLATMMHRCGDGMWNTDDESSWDEDRDTREIWSKKNNNKSPSVGRRLGSDSDRSNKMKLRRRSLSSGHDADRAGTATLLFEEKRQAHFSNTGRRVYLCRKCGVPRKGHTCPSGSAQNRKGPSTESFSPAHVLAEEVRLYLLDSRTTDRSNVFHSRDVDTDTKLLECWAADVSNKFSPVKDPAEKKIHLIDKRKSLTKSINKERDALITLRSKIRQVQNDCRILEGRIADLREENSALVGASNFLYAIDTLR
jgi:hypothetical protein